MRLSVISRNIAANQYQLLSRYHEGKEHMDAWKNRKPGELSDSLKSALGITADMPPPWLYAMQRYGPPPSYPFLKIPGVNAPIPAGAEWGYHRGGWGCPPVDIVGVYLQGVRAWKWFLKHLPFSLSSLTVHYTAMYLECCSRNKILFR